MSRKKDVSLQVESFHRGEDEEFQIHSNKEMQFILEDIAEKGTRVVLYYDGPHEFILTTLLGANEEGVWLDVSPHEPENTKILRSRHLTVVSLHQGVKMQFAANDIQQALVGDDDAFYLPMPDYLLRIQRREYFRLDIPISSSLKCVIPINTTNSGEPSSPVLLREIVIMDISCGGIALQGGQHHNELRPGMTFHDCRIALPSAGTLVVTLEIRNQINLENSIGPANIRIGCQFVRLDNSMMQLLQHYINRLQSEALAPVLP